MQPCRDTTVKFMPYIFPVFLLFFFNAYVHIGHILIDLLLMGTYLLATPDVVWRVCPMPKSCAPY